MTRFFNILCWFWLLFMLMAWVSIPLSFSQDVWWFKHDPYAQVAHWETAGSATEWYSDISSTRVRTASGYDILPATAGYKPNSIIILTTDGIASIPHILSSSRWERLDKEVKVGAGLSVVYATDSTTISADPTRTPQPTATPTPTFSRTWTGDGTIAGFPYGATWNFPSEAISGFYQEIIQPTDAKYASNQTVYLATHELGTRDVLSEVIKISNQRKILHDTYLFSTTQTKIVFFEKPDFAFKVNINRSGVRASGTIEVHNDTLERDLASNHPQYLHRTDGGTVAGPVSFSPPSASPPFLIGANADNETVPGLSAHYWNKVQSITFHATEPIFITDTTTNNERNVSIEMTPTPTFTPSPTPTPKAESGDFYATTKVYNMFHDMQHPFIQIRNADSNYQHHLLYIEHGSGSSKAVFFDNSNQSRFSYVAIASATSIPFGGTGRSYTLDPGYGSTTQSLVQIERGDVIQGQSVTDLGDGTYRVTLAQPQTGMQANFIIADGTAALGDGTSRTVTLTHDSNTYDVVVQFFLASTGQLIYPDVVHSSSTSIQAHFPYVVTSNSVIGAWKAEPTAPTDTFNEFGEVTVMNNLIRDSRIIADTPEDRFSLDFRSPMRASGSNTSKLIAVSIDIESLVNDNNDNDSLTSFGNQDFATQPFVMDTIAAATKIIWGTASQGEVIQTDVPLGGDGIKYLDNYSFHSFRNRFDTDGNNGDYAVQWGTTNRVFASFDRVDIGIGEQDAYSLWQAGIIPGSSPAGDGMESPEVEVFERLWIPSENEVNNDTAALRINQTSSPIQLQGSTDGTTWIDLTGDLWQTPLPTNTPPPPSPTKKSIFKTIITSSGTSPVADSEEDSLTLIGSGAVTVTGNSAVDIVTIDVPTVVATATEKPNPTPQPTTVPQDLWYTISTSSGTSPQADAAQDTLTFIGGTNITVTGNNAADTVTIDSSAADDQTLAEVLTEGNTANMNIDMDDNYLLNVLYADITSLDILGHIDVSSGGYIDLNGDLQDVNQIDSFAASNLDIDLDSVGVDLVIRDSSNNPLFSVNESTGIISATAGIIASTYQHPTHFDFSIDGVQSLQVESGPGAPTSQNFRLDLLNTEVWNARNLYATSSYSIGLDKTGANSGSNPTFGVFIDSTARQLTSQASTTINATRGISFDVDALSDITGNDEYKFYETHAEFDTHLEVGSYPSGSASNGDVNISGEYLNDGFGWYGGFKQHESGGVVPLTQNVWQAIGWMNDPMPTSGIILTSSSVITVPKIGDYAVHGHIVFKDAGNNQHYHLGLLVNGVLPVDHPLYDETETGAASTYGDVGTSEVISITQANTTLSLAIENETSNTDIGEIEGAQFWVERKGG